MIPRPRVMIVDDELPVLKALARALAGEPYDVTTTSDPAAAVRTLRTEAVDLLLADFKMPGMNGSELLALAAEASPETLRILLTGYPGEAGTPAGRPSSELVLQKPWDNAVLRRTIREALARRRLDAGRAGTG